MAKRKYETSRRTNLRDVHTFDQPCRALMSAMGGKPTLANDCRFTNEPPIPQEKPACSLHRLGTFIGQENEADAPLGSRLERLVPKLHSSVPASVTQIRLHKAGAAVTR